MQLQNGFLCTSNRQILHGGHTIETHNSVEVVYGVQEIIGPIMLRGEGGPNHEDRNWCV